MKVNLVYFLSWLLYIYVNVSSEQSVIPSGSCENMFTYVREGYEWIGIAQMPAPVPLAPKIKLEIILSLNSQLPMQYTGAIEPIGTRENLLQEIQFNQLIRFRVRFPLQNPLPKLMQISVNDDIFCTKLPDAGSNVTQIRLEHNLFTELAYSHPQHQSVTHPSFETQFMQPLHTSNTPTTSYTSSSVYEVCGRFHAKYYVSVWPSSEAVKRGTWPWLVAVYLDNATGPSFLCTGSLVTTRTVVTAASCFRKAEKTYQAPEILLFLGRQNILDRYEYGIKETRVEQIKIHTDYMTNGTSFDADIALAIMPERVEFTDYIRPICLWQSDDSFQYLQFLRWGYLIGWQFDGTGKNVSPEPRKYNFITEKCSQSLRNDTSERTFCVSHLYDYDLFGCRQLIGDGMAFNINDRWFLRGVVNSLDSDQMILTDAAKFIGWIKLNMQ